MELNLLQNLFIFKILKFTRAGSMYHAFKKEFSTSYRFEEQGTSEWSESFQIDFKWAKGSLKLS